MDLLFAGYHGCNRWTSGAVVRTNDAYGVVWPRFGCVRVARVSRAAVLERRSTPKNRGDTARNTLLDSAVSKTPVDFLAGEWHFASTESPLG